MKYKIILIYLRLDNKKINKTKNKEIMAFKMKNKLLAKSAKSRSPMQANYSPMKIDFLKKLLRKGDQLASDFGDYYSDSKIGKFMKKADEAMADFDPVRNIRQSLKKSKRNKAAKK